MSVCRWNRVWTWVGRRTAGSVTGVAAHSGFRGGAQQVPACLPGCRRPMSASPSEALEAMRSRASAAAHKAGFVDRQVQLPSGEPLTFLERPPEGGGGARSVVVFLHGMTNDRMLSAASFVKTAEQLPHARCLLPDAAGHGGRLEWAMRGRQFAMSADGHVSDFEVVLQAMLAADGASPEGVLTCSQREQEVFAPIDLIGYSMGGSTAFRFAAQHPRRVRNIALLAPALMLHDDQVAATAAAAQAECFDDIVYNYTSEEQALEFCRVVGWPAANAKRLAPMLVAGREGHPPDYWARIWLSFAGAYALKPDGNSAGRARSAQELFVSHMQAVAQFGVQLRASGRRVLVVQVGCRRMQACACVDMLRCIFGVLFMSDAASNDGSYGHQQRQGRRHPKRHAAYFLLTKLQHKS